MQQVTKRTLSSLQLHQNLGVPGCMHMVHCAVSAELTAKWEFGKLHLQWPLGLSLAAAPGAACAHEVRTRLVLLAGYWKWGVGAAAGAAPGAGPPCASKGPFLDSPLPCPPRNCSSLHIGFLPKRMMAKWVSQGAP